MGPAADGALNDDALERRCLGALMLFSEADDRDSKRALALLRPRDFFSENHRLIFTTIVTLEKRGLHFGLEAVFAALDRRGKINGTLSHWDLEQMLSESSAALPIDPVEQAVQIRQYGEYRDVLIAAREFQRFAEFTTDGAALRARWRELGAGLEREALVQNVQTQTFRELMDTEFPPEVPVVEPLVYAGDCLLVVGNAKTGKSVFALQLAMAVAAGGLALGTLPVHRQRPVLYLNLDDKPSRVKARGRYMLAAYPDGTYPEALDLAHRWPPIDRGGEGLLRQWAEGHPEGVIVIDLLERIRPVRGGHIYESDFAALGPLSDIAHAYGIAVLVIHHTNKAGLAPGATFDPDYAVSGSVAVRGAVDGDIVFHPASADTPDTRRISLKGRDAQATEYQLTWDDLLHGWRWEGESMQRQITKRLPHRRQQVLDAIQQAGRPLHRTEIAERLEANLNQIDNLLFHMKRATPPQIIELGDGKYDHPAEHARKGGAPAE